MDLMLSVLVLNFQVYYSEQLLTVFLIGIEGKCQVVKKHDLPFLDGPIEHVFFCEHLYDPDKGTIKQVFIIFPSFPLQQIMLVKLLHFLIILIVTTV